MGLGCVVCFVLAYLGIETGDPVVAAFFGIIGVWLLYMWATKEERKKKKAEEAEKRREEQRREKERNEKKELRQQAIARFNTSPFVLQIVKDFRSRNWRDLDYSKGGCVIYYDKIVTPYRTYVYINYDLARLDQNGCQELAEILGMAYSQANKQPYTAYTAQEKQRFVGGRSNSISGHYNESTNEFMASPDVVESYVFEGYMLYSNDTVPPPPPTGKAW